MFSKILIANRGEIAVRVIRTCRRMGIATVAVYSEADAESLAVSMADEAVFIGPAPAAQSYLVPEKIIAAAHDTGSAAIHPGFGFLSEKASFARACAQAGLVFIGPNPEAIDAMGDKIQSKKFAARAGVSVVPGHVGEIDDAAHAVRVSEELGYPVMLKASAGGGGKGIRVAWSRRDVEEGFPAVRAEAAGAFDDDRIFIEKFIEDPRHIEIQVLGDKHGHVLHLFERECSIQRRNQKVIEEAPSPLLDATTRAAMGAQAVALAKAVAYDSAGTVEFVAGQDKSFYFLEMNTRLQVEHPVTELITGVDLVEQMIRVAAGEPLAFGQEDLAIKGWAMESRIYAEDPYRRFLPSIGRLTRYRPPPEGDRGDFVVRNETGVREGDEISTFYDPMIAKLCAWGADRPAAILGMSRALEQLQIEGPSHNTPFLAAVMDEPRFASGALSTNYIASVFPDGFRSPCPQPWQADVMLAATLAAHVKLADRAASLGGPVTQGKARTTWEVVSAGVRRPIVLERGSEGLTIRLPQESRAIRIEAIDWRPGSPLLSGVVDGRQVSVMLKPAAEGFDVSFHGVRQHVLVLTPLSADLRQRLPARPLPDTSRLVISPMPGLIVSVDVAQGEDIKEGQVICVVEAMKMQNIIRAERDGVIKSLGARAGETVAADDVLAEFA
jgi:propionyl-CoA carboxylase alpha chain